MSAPLHHRGLFYFRCALLLAALALCRPLSFPPGFLALGAGAIAVSVLPLFPRFRSHALLQGEISVAADTLLAVFLVGLTEGVKSPFLFTLCLPILEAAALLSRRAMLGSALAALLCLNGFGAFQGYGQVFLLPLSHLLWAFGVSICCIAFSFSVIHRLCFQKEARICELEGEKQALLDLSERDLSTGLFKPSAFHQRFVSELHRALAGGSPLSLLLIRVDGEESNRDGGLESHPALLYEVIALLSGCIRNYDTLGRLDENLFGVLLPEVAFERVKPWVERLYAVSRNEKFRLSVGWAGYPERGADAQSLLGEAHRSLEENRQGISGFRVCG